MSDIRYAFYSPSASQHKGDAVYLRGILSDGLDRTYFGSDLSTAQKHVKAARDQKYDYRLDELTYERFGGELTCKVHNLAVWPPRQKRE